MYIKTLSRDAMQFIIDQLPDLLDRFHVISVYDLGHEPLFPAEEKRVLSLQFSDCSYKVNFYTVPMSIKQGRKVLKFLKEMPKDKDLLVHCYAGISRSGAIATFAMEFFGTDMKEFCELNPDICPNTYVLSTLRKLAGQ